MPAAHPLDRVPPFTDLLAHHGVDVDNLTAALGEYQQLLEELLLEADSFAEPYHVLDLSDRRDELAPLLTRLLG